MSSKKVTIKLPKLKDHQQVVHDNMDKSNIIIILSATKTGKSFFAIYQSLYHLFFDPDGSIVAYVGPYYSVSKMIFDRVLSLIHNNNLYMFFEINRTSLSIKSKLNNNTLKFLSAQNSDAIYGSEYSFIVAEEISRWDEAAWAAIVTTSTPRNAKILLIGNITSNRHFSYDLFLKARSGAKGFSCYSWTWRDSVDSGLTSIASIEKAKSVMSEQDFLRDYENVPPEAAAQLFKDKFLINCIKPISTNKPIVYGLDIAKRVDYTVLIGLDSQNQVCEYHRFQDDYENVIDFIKSLNRDIPILMDSTGVGDALLDRLRNENCNIDGYLFTNKSKNELITNLLIAIEKNEIYFPKNTIYDELSLYEYKVTSSGNITYSAPMGQHDDTVIALALALWAAKNRYSITI